MPALQICSLTHHTRTLASPVLFTRDSTRLFVLPIRSDILCSEYNQTICKWLWKKVLNLTLKDYLKDRKRERIFYLLVHFLVDDDSQGWNRWGPGTPSEWPMTGKHPKTWAVTCCLPGTWEMVFKIDSSSWQSSMLFKANWGCPLRRDPRESKSSFLGNEAVKLKLGVTTVKIGRKPDCA